MTIFDEIENRSFKGGRRKQELDKTGAEALIAASNTKDAAQAAARTHTWLQSRQCKIDSTRRVRSNECKSDNKMTNYKPQHNRHSNTRSNGRYKDTATFPAFSLKAGRHNYLVLLAFFFLLTNSVFGSSTLDFMVDQGNEMLRSGYVHEGAQIFKQLLDDKDILLNQFQRERVQSRLEIAKSSMSLQRLIACDYTKQVDRLCQQATRDLYSDDNKAKALASLEVGLQLLELAACHRGRDEDYRRLMATCLIYQDRYKEGLHFLRKVAKERADYPETWNMMAWYYRSIGNKKLELKALNRSVLLDREQKYVQGRRCQLLIHFDTPPLLKIACDTAVKAAGDDMQYLDELSLLFPEGSHRERLQSIVRDRRIAKVHSGTALVLGVSTYKAPANPEQDIPSGELE